MWESTAGVYCGFTDDLFKSTHTFIEMHNHSTHTDESFTTALVCECLGSQPGITPFTRMERIGSSRVHTYSMDASLT